MTTEQLSAGARTVSAKPSPTEWDSMDRFLAAEPQPTPDQEVEAALDYLESDRTGSAHLTTPITDRLVKGAVDEQMARVVRTHLRTCGWCRRMLRDTLEMSKVPADHPACALLSQSDPWFAEAQDGLDSLRDIPEGWDGHSAEAPNDTALAKTRRVLDILQSIGFRPDRIAPSAEGGIMLSFYVGRRYGDIEMFNTGEVLAVTSDGGGSPHVWEVAEDETAITDTLGSVQAALHAAPRVQEATDLDAALADEVLHRYSTWNYSEVRALLVQHSEVCQALIAALPHVEDAFGEGTNVGLQVLVDHDGEGDVVLNALIQTPDSVDEALEKRRRFNRQWWSEARKSVRGLSFDVDCV